MLHELKKKVYTGICSPFPGEGRRNYSLWRICPDSFVSLMVGLFPFDRCGNRGAGGLFTCLSKVTQMAVTPVACPRPQEPPWRSKALPARVQL